MNFDILEQTTQNARKTILEVSRQLSDAQSKWQMSAPPSGFLKATAALANPEYDVVVCGEVKRGKSTFINALIGRPILPTGVRETTSQVFRISHSQSESFALVFEDEHREPITLEELTKYGSQTAAELDGLPLFRGRVLRWIEVQTPCAFLPPGVHLVDTPGLGALYASHSEITNRYILRADAAIFVLDSDQPLTQPEKRFLEKVFAVTPNVLFVQTKIDTKDESAWQAIRDRNEILLNDAFGREGHPQIRACPVSSELLFRAAGETEPQEKAYLLADSLFEDARKALDRLIYRAAGWTRSAWAAAEAARYIHSLLQSFDEQRQMIEANTAAEKTAIRQRKIDIRTQFQKDWGGGGVKRAQFMAELQRILRGVRQAAYGIGAQGTELHTRLLNDIGNLLSRQDIEQFAKEMPERVRTGFECEWQEIVLQAHRQIAALDQSFAMTEDGIPPLAVSLQRLTLKNPSVWDRIKAVNIDGMVGGGLAAIVAGLFLTGGFATLLMAAGGLLGGAQGFSRVQTQQLESARNEIKQHLSALLAHCRNALCTPDMSHGRNAAPVDSFLDGLQSQVELRIGEQYEGKRDHLELEERRLDEQSKMTGQRRDDELKTVQSRSAQVKALETTIQKVIGELRETQTSLDHAAG
jgi:signal recognition particle receptor subunit beta